MVNYSDFKGEGIPRFPDNSRVCFLGDSITSASLWTEVIFEHYLKAMPEASVRIFDAGIGGGTAEYGLSCINEDLYTFDPTHVVIMYAANDIGCYEGTSEEREEHFYRDMKALTDEILSKGITVYYMTYPGICDRDVGEIDIASIGRRVMLRLAEEMNTSVCDLYTYMRPFRNMMDLYDPDRVHFSLKGQSVIARLFLHSQGFDGFDPDGEGFFDTFILPYDGDHRRIFNEKVRRIWLAILNISTAGDTTEAKIERLKGRIITRGDGAWDDFCYYRAVDFIELYPNFDFYKDMLQRITDKMISDAKNK